MENGYPRISAKSGAADILPIPVKLRMLNAKTELFILCLPLHLIAAVNSSWRRGNPC